MDIFLPNLHNDIFFYIRHHIAGYKRSLSFAALVTEDTLLSAMERAGNEELTEDTEKKGLGTPGNQFLHQLCNPI